jgi:hypothetical protein
MTALAMTPIVAEALISVQIYGAANSGHGIHRLQEARQKGYS